LYPLFQVVVLPNSLQCFSKELQAEKTRNVKKALKSAHQMASVVINAYKKSSKESFARAIAI
jgi:hypothetical protein